MIVAVGIEILIGSVNESCGVDIARCIHRDAYAFRIAALTEFDAVDVCARWAQFRNIAVVTGAGGTGQFVVAAVRIKIDVGSFE